MQGSLHPWAPATASPPLIGHPRVHGCRNLVTDAMLHLPTRAWPPARFLDSQSHTSKLSRVQVVAAVT